MTSKHVTENTNFPSKIVVSLVKKDSPIEKESLAKNVKWRGIVLLKNVVEGKMLQIGEKAFETQVRFEKVPKKSCASLTEKSFG